MADRTYAVQEVSRIRNSSIPAQQWVDKLIAKPFLAILYAVQVIGNNVTHWNGTQTIGLGYNIKPKQVRWKHWDDLPCQPRQDHEMSPMLR